MCKQIFITRALFNLYAHTVAVIRLRLLKKNNPLLKYQQSIQNEAESRLSTISDCFNFLVSSYPQHSIRSLISLPYHIYISYYEVISSLVLRLDVRTTRSSTLRDIDPSCSTTQSSQQ